MRAALVALLVLACRSEDKKPAPEPARAAAAAPAPAEAPLDAASAPAVAVTLEPAAATDAALAAVGTRLTPDAPVLALADLRPHLVPLSADCERGSDVACAVFDNIYRYSELLARKASEEERAGLVRDCRRDKSDLGACALAGEALYDPARAEAAGDLFGLACFQGIGRACGRMGRLRLEPGAEDPTFSAERARTLLADACAERDAEACAAAGDLSRACDLADFASCEALIRKGEAAEIARGLAVFRAACMRKHAPSCNAASTLTRALAGRAAPAPP